MKKIIYDLGANNGDDIPYYLLKADLVVAVEANPALCDQIHARFHQDVQAGRLAVENCVVAAEGEGLAGPVDFYLHKTDPINSQLPPPSPGQASSFEKVSLPSKTASEILRTHGDPYYIKVDIEYYDAHILRDLFRAGIFPPYLSAESHSVEVFALMVAEGHYNAFKLVDGRSVSDVYRKRWIQPHHGGDPVPLSFPFHSAGPFGDDVDGPWMTADNFLRVLAFEGMGWKDIHATNQVYADPLACPSTSDLMSRSLSRTLKARKYRAGVRLRRLLSRSHS